MLDAINIPAANGPANDTDFDAWTKANRVIAAANAGQLQGFKNKLINGSCLVNQRNADAAVAIGTGAHAFVCDRWSALAAGAAVTAQRVTTTNIPGFRRALRITGAASNTNVFLRQRLEADDVAQFAGQTVALAFTVYHTLGAGRQFQASVSRANAADVFTTVTQEDVTKTTAAVANAVATRVVVTFAVSASAVTGLELVISTNGGVLAGQTVEITGVQLEQGVEDTAFENRPSALERALCRRFARPLIEGPGALFGFRATASVLDFMVQFEPMRAAPGFSQSSPTWVTTTPAGGANTIGVYGGVSGFLSITGALSLALPPGFVTPTSAVLRFTAGTSFGGAAGEAVQAFIGSGVSLLLDAEFT